MLNEEQNNKFIILCKEIVPEYMLRTEKNSLMLGDLRDKEIFSCFYQYDNANINFVFTRLHFESMNGLKNIQIDLVAGIGIFVREIEAP